MSVFEIGNFFFYKYISKSAEGHNPYYTRCIHDTPNSMRKESTYLKNQNKNTQTQTVSSLHINKVCITNFFKLIKPNSIFKTACIPLPPYTPHQTQRSHSPNRHQHPVTLLPPPTPQHLFHRSQHYPHHTKQLQD